MKQHDLPQDPTGSHRPPCRRCPKMTVECIRGCLIEGPQLFEAFPELSSFTVFTEELSSFTERFRGRGPWTLSKYARRSFRKRSLKSITCHSFVILLSVCHSVQLSNLDVPYHPYPCSTSLVQTSTKNFVYSIYS